MLERAYTTHGTTTEYRNGCRCRDCKLAKMQSNHNYWNHMTNILQCMVPQCERPQALAMKRGLCMPCYSKAKKMVESGKTTWEQLEEMGLSKSQEDDPFTEAFNAAKK